MVWENKVWFYPTKNHTSDVGFCGLVWGIVGNRKRKKPYLLGILWGFVGFCGDVWDVEWCR